MKKSNIKKESQLGMGLGRASHKLLKDILFDFVSKTGHKCHHCGQQMERDNFSIEHKTPWLDSESPTEIFFDLENIGYSHLKCNIRAARRKGSSYSKEERLAIRAKRWATWKKTNPEKWREMKRRDYQKKVLLASSTQGERVGLLNRNKLGSIPKMPANHCLFV